MSSSNLTRKKNNNTTDANNKQKRYVLRLSLVKFQLRVSDIFPSSSHTVGCFFCQHDKQQRLKRNVQEGPPPEGSPTIRKKRNSNFVQSQQRLHHHTHRARIPITVEGSSGGRRAIPTSGCFIMPLEI